MNKVLTLGGKSMSWRYDIENETNNKVENSVEYIHLPKYDVSHMEYLYWFINKVLECDVVIANLEKIDDDAKHEITIISTLNAVGNKHIFVVGFGKHDKIPKFIRQSLFYVADTLEDAVDYAAKTLLH